MFGKLVRNVRLTLEGLKLDVENWIEYLRHGDLYVMTDRPDPWEGYDPVARARKRVGVDPEDAA